MHSSDQQPADETQEQREFQPLYEFPPGGPLLNEAPQPAPITRVLPEAGQGENIQQGFVYPPPPSYYQNMTIPPELPPPPRMVRQQAPAGLSYEPAGQIQQRGRGVQTSAVPPVKKSYKWVWIVVSVLSVVVLASCGLCGWAAYTLFATSFQQVSGSLDVVNDYYTDFQSQNYIAAYSDLAPQGQISGLTQKQFVAQASKLDAEYGPVVSFVPGQPALDPNSGTDLSRFTITVNVKRTHLSSYAVLLTVSKIRGNWKITEYDRL